MKPRCHFASGGVEAWPFVSFLFDEPFQDHVATAGAEWAWLGLVASHRGSTVQQVLPESVYTWCIIFVISCLLKWNNCAHSLHTVAKQFINERFHTRLQAGQMKKYRCMFLPLSLPSNQFVCICVCMSMCVHKCACTHAYICMCVHVCKYTCP